MPADLVAIAILALAALTAPLAAAWRRRLATRAWTRSTNATSCAAPAAADGG